MWAKIKTDRRKKVEQYLFGQTSPESAEKVWKVDEDEI